MLLYFGKSLDVLVLSVSSVDWLYRREVWICSRIYWTLTTRDYNSLPALFLVTTVWRSLQHTLSLLSLSLSLSLSLCCIFISPLVPFPTADIPIVLLSCCVRCLAACVYHSINRLVFPLTYVYNTVNAFIRGMSVCVSYHDAILSEDTEDEWLWCEHHPVPTAEVRSSAIKACNSYRDTYSPPHTICCSTRSIRDTHGSSTHIKASLGVIEIDCMRAVLGSLSRIVVESLPSLLYLSLWLNEADPVMYVLKAGCGVEV
jgi:hypothetical protein